MNDSKIQLLYCDSHETLEQVACQLTNVVGIAAGIGALPLLRDHLDSRFWLAEAAVGALVIAVGLFFLERRAQRLLPFLKGLFALLRHLPSAIKRLLTFLRGLPAFFRRLPAFIRRAWDWIRLHLPGRRKAIPGPVPPETSAVQEYPPMAARSAAPSTASTLTPPVRELVLLPYLALLIGLFILLPALLVAFLHQFWAPELEQLELEQIAIYFSAPALLIWVIGEIPYILSKIVVKPWDGSIVTGILKSGLQVLSAVLVWVFLALSLGGEEHTWLLFGGLGLALVGLVFGFISVAIERRRLRTRPQNARRIQVRETAG